jgi:4-hydroxybenzoyl-CoA thioesterase
MIFSTSKKIRFHHCDPAGIVFYPQFFYLLHEAQEDFLAHIGFPEHTLIGRGFGVPIVDLKTEFLRMCRFGDEVTINLELVKLGSSSIGMRYEIRENQPADPRHDLKLRASSVVVYSQLPHGKPVRIPDDLRAALLPYLQNETPDTP